jgi:xanthine/uracil permease
MLLTWREKRSGTIAPDERLPWGGTVALGVQHVLAMFGATVVAPTGRCDAAHLPLDGR